MDHRQARKTGWTIIGCGCVFIILTKLWVGLAMAARSSVSSVSLGMGLSAKRRVLRRGRMASIASIRIAPYLRWLHFTMRIFKNQE